MAQFFSWNTPWNWISILLCAVLLGSVIQGARKGASGSATYLFRFIIEGLLTFGCIIAAWQSAGWLSPLFQQWLETWNVKIPTEGASWFKQWFYTMFTAIRDFQLFRMGVLFLLSYILIKQILYWAFGWLIALFPGRQGRAGQGHAIIGFNGLTGAVIGGVIGAARSILIVVFLFVFVTLVPNSPLSNYIQDSHLYQQASTQIVQPFTGDFIKEQLPVFTRAVEEEFNKILQRKYEVIDQNIPQDIQAAAQEITKKAVTDEEKAKALYNWIGNRISYDHEKVRLYEEEQIWKEQTPEDTFKTRSGVCIDYARLYAVMARSVDLKVKVVTGLGYDGRGGYGPHAWNEVLLGPSEGWIPLDSTWASSGGDWFNPPNFYQTHIRDRGIYA